MNKEALSIIKDLETAEIALARVKLFVEQTQPPAAPPQTPTFIERNIVTDFGAIGDGKTDANPAFTAFNTWARQQTLPVRLILPAGEYAFVAPGSGNWIVRGIKKLTVVGYGATLSDGNGTGNGFFLGGGGVWESGLHSARVETVAAGADSVKLLDPANAAIYTVGSWAMMAGLDMIGYGYPPNPAFFEFAQITAIDAINGIVTFSKPLRNEYKSTWPAYWSTSSPGASIEQVDQGGWATLYALHLEWDTEVEYQGVTIAQPNNQTYAIGRSITFRDCKVTGRFGLVPTQNQTWRAINTDMSDAHMEVDKLCEQIVLDRCTLRAMSVQSSSVDLLKITNGTKVTQWINGTPRRIVIDKGSDIASLGLGTLSYGITESAIATDCVIRDVVPLGMLDRATKDLTIAGGVIKVPRSHGPVSWAIPGAVLSWQGYLTNEGPSFRVLDVWAGGLFFADGAGRRHQDANIYIKTSLPDGFPTLQLAANSPDIGIRTHPCPRLTFRNVTGCATAVELSQAPAGAPLGSYTKITLNKDQPARGIYAWGRLISAKFNVPQPSASPISVSFDGPFTPHLGDPNPFNVWDPKINASIAGERTITPEGSTGAQQGDNLIVPGLGTWIVSGQITAKFSSAPTDDVSVTVEIITDQDV